MFHYYIVTQTVVLGLFIFYGGCCLLPDLSEQLGAGQLAWTPPSLLRGAAVLRRGLQGAWGP